MLRYEVFGLHQERSTLIFII